jgi:Fe-S-cluster-containing hydrogenase component 2
MGIEIERSECTGCGCCVDVCPVEAIRLVDGRAVVYQEICTECGDCVMVCPVEAISLSEPESVGVLVPSDQQGENTSLEIPPSSPLSELVPWAGAALMVVGKQIARNVAEVMLAALEERTVQSTGNQVHLRASDGVVSLPRGGKGKRQRRRRRGTWRFPS